MQMRVRIARLLVILAMMAGPGCRSPKIAERPTGAQPAPSFDRGAYSASFDPSVAADVAGYAGLMGVAERPDGTSPEQLLVLSEEAGRIGCRLNGLDPVAALTWHRDAAAYAMFALSTAGPGKAASEIRARAITQHNREVEQLLRCAGTGPRGVIPSWREQLAAAGIAVAPTTAERAAIPCDELWICRDFRVKNMERVCRNGLGLPLIVLSKFPDRRASPGRFLPERLRLPATAVLHPNGPLRDGVWRSRHLVLALHDPSTEAVVVSGPSAGGSPLAADWTTPLAHQFINSPLAQFAMAGLLRPESYNGVAGIYMYGPYRPGKVPILFIHGLGSSPDAWLTMANGLQADPFIRERYQFWFAYYPSGSPLMFSAVRLRQSLQDLRQAIDPSAGDSALDNMVLVGHSLGGVLSKQLIQGSGQNLERALFTRPFAEVAMSPESRQMVARLLYFEPVPSVKRAVFICAPHRGSNTANQLIGRLSSALVSRPGDVAALHAEVITQNGPEVLQPWYRRRPPSSIDNLDWESPILKTLSELPTAPGIPYHSVVATLFPTAPTRMWTDGVVSYASAHLPRADSEIVVNHDHTANDAPEATAEVRRILRLHLEGQGDPAGSGRESRLVRGPSLSP